MGYYFVGFAAVLFFIISLYPSKNVNQHDKRIEERKVNSPICLRKSMKLLTPREALERRKGSEIH